MSLTDSNSEVNDLAKPLQKNVRHLKDFFDANAKLKAMKVKGGIDKDLVIQEYLPHYFDRISEICVFLLSKSDFSKEEKMYKRARMKMVAWEYLYDVEDGEIPSIETYFEQLLQVLNDDINIAA